MKVFKKHYSGKLSNSFWNKINKNGSSTAYSMGCALQDIENTMLTRIELAMINHKIGLNMRTKK